LTDPIDGTSYFSNLEDGWTVLVSLQQHKEQVFGLVYSPLRDTFYYASKGHGAFKQIGNDTPTQIFGKKWSNEESLIPISQDQYPHGANRDMQFLETLGYGIGKSDTSLKINRFAAVAEGEGHFALSGYGRNGPKEWDLATCIIVSESGGKTILRDAPYEIGFGKPNRQFRHVITVSDANATDTMIAHLKLNP
jgi:3'(2'), 5'-bisphosphate nucleotidase